MKLLRESHTKRDSHGWLRKYYFFLCPSCKNEVIRPFSHGNRDKSCGCARYDHGHGHARKKGGRSRLYKTWEGVIQRGTNPNSHNWYSRGIRVCEEWKDFIVFKDWALANGYSNNLYIDRIDNNGNYEPSNCRFISHAQNSRNSRIVKLDWPKIWIIRGLYSSGISTKKRIADIFNVTVRNISYIVNYRTWNK